jgi:hypothetical protein
VFAFGHGDVGEIDGRAAAGRGRFDRAVVMLEAPQMGCLSVGLHDRCGSAWECSSCQGSGDDGADALP